MTADDEDRVFFLGYNAHQEVVVKWQHQPKTSVIHPVESDAPRAVVQSDVEIELKARDSANDEKAAGDNG